jgi:hypothetical protein
MHVMEDLWAITSYFNPMRSGRRLSNYRAFRRHLGVPLVAVEWAWGSAPFELRHSDADVLVQWRGPDLIWQKERLLNLALRHVPAGCGAVACLDCDLVFESSDWHVAAVRGLEGAAMVHVCGEVRDAPPGWFPGDGRFEPIWSKRSIVSAWSDGSAPADILRRETIGMGFCVGCAWAGRADVLRRHGFYDGCPIGGGDRAILCAATGRFDDLIAFQRLNPARAEHYLAWARPFFETVGGDVTCAGRRACHLWHGGFSDRGYERRHEGFEPFGFDPRRDVALDANGCWRWASDKPAMHRYVLEYFRSRREDG